MRKQGVYFRLAAGEEQRQSVERTGERRAFDEVGAALTAPAGQLQQWIVICARTKARQWRAVPFEVSKATIDSVPSLLASGSSAGRCAAGPSVAAAPAIAAGAAAKR